MEPSNEHTISWSQPEGRWQSRGADFACLRLACGITPGSLSDQIIDAEGHTLWHYWAHGPAPHELMKEIQAVDDRAYRNTVSKAGEHPLHRLAAAGRHAALAEWDRLYGKEGWTDARNRYGDNLVACALWSGNEETARWAISISLGNLDNQDTAGLTCLSVAVHRCNEKVLEALLAGGADPMITDTQGRSPLHHAASRGFEDMFVLLEDAGCDPDEKDNGGSTAGSLMTRAVKSENLAVLEQHWKKRANIRLDF